MMCLVQYKLLNKYVRGGENVSESEEEEEDSVVSSYNEALNALATFRAFIDNVPETILKSIREVESFSMALRRSFTKQSTLDSFFVKELYV
jgi:hypothetical protein